jgi:hypothetical protein
MPNQRVRSRKTGKRLLWGQAGIVTVALLTALLLPMPGTAGVLIPLTAEPDASVAGWAVGHDLRILQRGAPDDGIVVLLPSAGTAWVALRDGMIILPATFAGCVGNSTQAGF